MKIVEYHYTPGEKQYIITPENKKEKEHIKYQKEYNRNYKKESYNRSAMKISRKMKEQGYKNLKFLTLTFSPASELTGKNPSEIKKQMQYFIRKIRGKYVKNIGYLYTIGEQLERSTSAGFPIYHIHLILFTNKYLPIVKLRQFWNFGYITINALKNFEAIKNITGYILKHQHPQGNRYYSSKKLKEYKTKWTYILSSYDLQCMINENAKSSTVYIWKTKDYRGIDIIIIDVIPK